MNSSRLPTRDHELAAFLASPVPRRVPARLLKSASRQSSLTSKFWAGLIFGAFGLYLLTMVSPWGIWRDWQLSFGDVASAKGRIIFAAETNLALNDTKVWRYLFEYPRTEAMGPMRGECFTTGARWRPGDAVGVRYFPAGTTACVEGARTTEAGLWSLWALLFPALGFGLAVHAFRAKRRLESILATGRSETARVMSVEKTLARENYKPVFVVWLQLGDAMTPVSLTLRCHDPDVVAFAESRLTAHQSVAILYDPKHPEQVVLPEAL